MQSFFVIVKDLDKGTFSVEGPMTDDTKIINQVCEIQAEEYFVKLRTLTNLLKN